MSSIREAVLKEREEIIELLSNYHFPWEVYDAPDEERMGPQLARIVAARSCNELGHIRGIASSQLTGREQCRRCGDEIFGSFLATEQVSCVLLGPLKTY